MDVNTVKLDLLVWLANLQDPRLLNQLLEFRKKTEKNGHSISLKPMTQAELVERALASEKAIAEGNVIDWEDMVNEKW
ncbi:MAG: hypothetical protein EPO28_18360 [Saprospiraceae bacterium]|nr:MAG: hypothetical protein EPO28_18360 [Saprospiraceae bacterium]